MFRRRYKPILREADKKFIKYKKTGEIAMKKLNVIIVFDKDENKILMCKRTKEPYKGKLNLVGGKVEKEEDELHAAYRDVYKRQVMDIMPKGISKAKALEELCKYLGIELAQTIVFGDGLNICIILLELLPRCV